MRNFTWLFVLVAFFAVAEAAAQKFTLSGMVIDSENQPIPGATVFLENTEVATTTDTEGKYTLQSKKHGKYTIVAFAFGMKTLAKQVVITKDQLIYKLNFTLKPLEEALSSVEVTGTMLTNTFGVGRLSAVQGTAIYEGKKSEVVIMKDMNANLATNNSRQVFSKVAGINIWESDGAGLQLGVGGRGLSPNRTANFNTRQNGYDISADPLGYPDAYYSPPMQSLEKIEVVRGAASLQYGPQFGGLVNFILKKGPKDKKFEFETANTVGSYGFKNTYNGIGGQVGKLNYYGYYQYRTGDAWRDNSGFEAHAAYGAATYEITDKLSITGEYSYLHYLAQQAGGLTDAEFAQDPQRSKRERNWFLIDWNVASFIIDYRFNSRTQLNIRTFGMNSGRDAIGNLGRIDRADDGASRTLLKDDYLNIGTEARLIHRYQLGSKGKSAVFLAGMRYFNGNTERLQGLGNSASTPDFIYTGEKGNNDSEFQLTSRNASGFIENIFDLNDQISITPGIRFEYIRTNADGFFRDIFRDLAGNIISENTTDITNENERTQWLAGIGGSYKPSQNLELYANVSQNYRPINFSDVAINIPSLRVDPNLKDETGFNADFGVRGNLDGLLTFDATVFMLRYANRIGEVLEAEDGNIYRFRTNISDSRNIGLETFVELDIWKLLYGKQSKTQWSVFSNATVLDARYIGSDEPAFEDRRVEYVPNVIVRLGTSFKHQGLQATYQYSYTSSQYSDATNAESRPEAVVGKIPAYGIMDLNLSYDFSHFKVQAGLNNIMDKMYFTRRATGYPGPGIVPSDGRTFYLTLSAKLGWK